MARKQKRKGGGFKFATVFDYATSRYERGDIFSRHRTYEAARKAAKRSGWDSFLSIREL